VVVGWTDPEGSRPWLGALLLAYYDPDNRLIYAGRAGPASTMPNLNGCGAAFSRWPFPKCPSTCRRRATAGSVRR
jgi:ATP-dependent DNA ligase